jgi:hypothetical protein
MEGPTQWVAQYSFRNKNLIFAITFQKEQCPKSKTPLLTCLSSTNNKDQVSPNPAIASGSNTNNPNKATQPEKP